MVKKNNGTIRSRGSSIKPSRGNAGSKARTKTNSKWREAKIAYDENGNIVVLDLAAARELRRLVAKDRMLDLGFPEKSMKVTSSGLAEVDPPPNTRDGIRPTNNQCQCGSLRLEVVAEDTPFRTVSPLF